jgi:hypothetical protein
VGGVVLKKAVAVVFVGCALAFIVPREVEAVPMQCPEPPERLTLSPYEVSVDGALQIVESFSAR